MDFNFWFPIEKAGAQEVGGKRFVYGVASSEDIDLDNEIVGADCIRKSLNYFLKSGRIDWDHRSKLEPKYIIGEPVKAAFDDKKNFHVKALLYKSVEIADQVWKQLKAGNNRLGWSIGGKVLKKSMQFQKSISKWVPRVTDAIINHIAITPHPKNLSTFATVTPYADFIKSLAVEGEPRLGRIVELDGQEYVIAKRDEIEKAIAAGADVAFQSGGGALRMQSLESDIKVFKSFVTSPKFSRDPEAIQHFFVNKGIDSEMAKAFSKYIEDNYERLTAIRRKSR